ncbi:MAG: hypothetical protein E3J21_17980 [Anaerolineales bacterium]|nr:MAG: hypothetical protein E3J21_17980 [Anaerolineales bacterium]
MEKKLKHLEMLQNIIDRMADNSFSLKGWSVVLVSALFALAASDSNTHFVYLAYLPSIMFWILDGYFLWQERLFRKLYDRVRVASESEIDFSMDTSSVRGEVSSWIGTMFSITLLIYHGTILGAVVVITIITLSSNP